MAQRVTLIRGDGIGPELAEATQRVLDASGVAFEWEVLDAGEAVMAEYGTPLPDHVLESIKRNQIAIKGPITTPVNENFRSINITLHQTLGLYANLQPTQSILNIQSHYKNVNLIIIRENTKNLYTKIKHQINHDTTKNIKI